VEKLGMKTVRAGIHWIPWPNRLPRITNPPSGNLFSDGGHQNFLFDALVRAGSDDAHAFDGRQRKAAPSALR
jgi:hypothetical protein